MITRFPTGFIFCGDNWSQLVLKLLYTLQNHLEDTKMKMRTLFIAITVFAFLANPAFAKKKKHKYLPPGLQKKLDRGQKLPPGWQKKIARGEVLDLHVYRHAQVIIPVDRYGVISVLIDNRVVRLIHATREIMSVFNYK